MRNIYKIVVEKMKGRDGPEHLGVDGTIKECDGRFWSELHCPKSCGETCK
jgi:hypothetical protein